MLLFRGKRLKGKGILFPLIVGLIGLLITSGCARISSRAIIHPHSEVTLPTFCLHSESSSNPIPKPLPIRRLEVHRSKISNDELIELGPDLELGKVYSRTKVNEAWIIEYLPDPLYRSLTPFCCITYGKLPPGYREKGPALPLIPEKVYMGVIRSLKGDHLASFAFIIRLDSSGKPVKLEAAGSRGGLNDVNEVQVITRQ